MFNKNILAAGILIAMSGYANASTIAFSGEIHTGSSQLSIHNMSDPGITISQITVSLGDVAVFSTTPAPAIDSGITITHFGADSKLMDDAADYTTATALDVGYTGSLATDIVQGANQASFSFNDFTAGEAWGIFVDFDTVNGAEDTPGGIQMNNTTIDVTFMGANGDTEVLSFVYLIGGGTSKKSFPTDPIPFNAASDLSTTISAVPVPAAAWLLGSGLLGLVAVGRRPML